MSLPYYTKLEPLQSDLSNGEKLIAIFSSTSFNEIRIVVCLDSLMRRLDILYSETFYTCTYV